jgi:hypothetical protein
MVVGIVDLAMRQVARRSLLELLGWDVSYGAVLVLVIVALAGAAHLLWWHRATVAGVSRVNRVVAMALWASFATGLVVQLQLGARLQSDGFYYYAYLRSLWFDGDVDFANDYRAIGLGDKPHLFEPTPTGYAQSAWTIGPAIIWSPFFGAGHLVASRLHAIGEPVSADGTSYPYRQAVCVAGLFYGVLGIWFCFLLVARFVRAWAAIAATVAITLASFMIWYLVKEPTMTHAPSMAAAAAFTYAWVVTERRRSLRGWLLLGLGAGVMTTIRWQNALLALLPLAESLWLLWSARRARDSPAFKATIVGGLAFTAAAVVGFLPQMLAWKSIYGQYLAVSPVGPQIRWWDPHLVDILWSSRNGLFSVTPVLYAAAIGLLLLLARAPQFAIPGVVAFGAMVYFNSTIQDWWGSAAFGMRRFDSLIPILAVGLGAFIEDLHGLVARRPAIVVGAVLSGLVLWNLALMDAALVGVMRIGEPVPFGEVGGYQLRTLHRWFGYPFSYPANLLFALRNGVAPARYDYFGPNRWLGDPRIPYGRVDVGLQDEPHIGAGWHGPEAGGGVTFRWATTDARLIVALDHAAPLRMQIRVQPLMFADAPPQDLWAEVNGSRLGPFRLQPGWQTVEQDVPEDVWRSGINRIALQFARGNRPRDVGLGGDDRLLSAAVDYVRVVDRRSQP